MAELSYRQALHDTLRDELLRDESVILLGEEIGVFEGSYKITAGLLTEFGPERVRDTPIAEEGFVGLATVDMRPTPGDRGFRTQAEVGRPPGGADTYSRPGRDKFGGIWDGCRWFWLWPGLLLSLRMRSWHRKRSA